MRMLSCIYRHTLLLALLLAGPVSAMSSPKALPKDVASHFCQLLVNDGNGRIYPLSMYAQHLTTLLYEVPHYEDFTAEQVLTGFIFYYDDWVQLPASSREALTLVQELHTGQTLRLFPHLSDGEIIWYAPTDPIPKSVGTEHRKYMQEVFSRLNGEVQAGNWQNVEEYIDKMIKYQCQYGNNGKSEASTPTYLIYIVALFLLGLVVISIFIRTFAPKITKQ